MSASSWLASDTLLALILPLVVLIFAARLLPALTIRDVWDILPLRRGSNAHGPFSLQRAARCYEVYGQLAGADVARMRTSYAKLGRKHKRMGYDLGYPKKLNEFQNAVHLNACLARQIFELAKEEFPGRVDDPQMVDSSDLGRARETMRHFVRDWSNEGKEERDRIFRPILDALKNVFGSVGEREGKTCLVPGAGLGRLAWDISELGFDTTANEISYTMTLALRLLLSPRMTPRLDLHTVQPYAHWFSHQRSSTPLFRRVTFPDALPRLSTRFHLLEDDFLALPHTPSCDVIVTLFFIDTSVNVLATIEHIHALLKPGGTWINLGPLLWLGGAQARVELSLEEVLRVLDQVGFLVHERQSVKCEYTADREAMMKWIYEAEFWVATKSKLA